MAGVGAAAAGLPAWAQPGPPPSFAPWNAGLDAIRTQGRYLPLLKAVQTTADPSGLGAQWAAYWGDETTALAHISEAPMPPLDLGGLTTDDAVTAIVRASEGRRVVMVNEAHVASRHRLFVADLLPALRRVGFTHYAAETFANGGAPERVEGLKAGDQVGGRHGGYVADPVFAETVRTALALDYQLVAYEASGLRSGAMSPIEAITLRETQQSANLAAALTRWPEGRFLVHVGHGHLAKAPDAGGNLWMAARLAKETGVEPLTIGQDYPGSYGPHGPDNALAQAVLARFSPKRTMVLRRADGTFVGSPGYYRTDMVVFHPNLPDVDGRPGWLAAAPARRRATARLATAAPVEPTLAQAIHVEDRDPAVPADQFVLRPGQRDLAFYLRPGRYRVRVETADGFAPVGEISV
jgi:hypothetical protein